MSVFLSLLFIYSIIDVQITLRYVGVEVLWESPREELEGWMSVLIPICKTTVLRTAKYSTTASKTLCVVSTN